MVSITADAFQAIMNLSDTDITNTNAENLIDQAVNRLNTYGLSIPNMTGAAESKTLSVSSGEAGAIYEVARIIYYGYYKGQETVAIQGLSASVPNLLGNANVEAQIKSLAYQLLGRGIKHT